MQKISVSSRSGRCALNQAGKENENLVGNIFIDASLGLLHDLRYLGIENDNACGQDHL